MSYFLPNTNSNRIDFLCVILRVLWNSFAHIFSSALIGHRNCWCLGSKQDWFTWPGNIWSYYLSCSRGNVNDYTNQKTFTRCCVRCIVFKRNWKRDVVNISNHMLFINLSYHCSDCVQAILILLFCSLDEMDLVWGVQHLVFVKHLHIMISIYIIHCLQVIFSVLLNAFESSLMLLVL